MRIINTLSFAAAVVATASLIPSIASAERVCRQECVGPVCSERCTETEGRGDRREGVEIRRENREESRELDGRAPGVELRVPGVKVEIGGGRR
jgi:hypothetical protein